MKCRDFERAWNELFDARVDGRKGDTPGAIAGELDVEAFETERALKAHAAACPVCRQVADRYLTLRRAVREWARPPVPSAELSDRILAALDAPTPSAWPIYRVGTVRQKRNWPVIAVTAALTAAAVLMALALPAILMERHRKQMGNAPVVAHNTPLEPRGKNSRETVTPTADARALNVAVAEATAATLDLARTASLPAARISRDVLGGATEPDPEPKSAKVLSTTATRAVATRSSVPTLDQLAPEATAAGVALQQVGNRLSTGVRPLSDSARHAFGFLLGTPVAAKPEPSINPPTQKGA